MNDETNAINWFEIPVLDMARATHFYQVAFGIHMKEEHMMQMHLAYFPMEMGNGKVSGALVKSDFHQPSEQGVLIYLNANPDLSEVLSRVETEGGRILMPKSAINEEIGYMAVFLDREGNRIALHSQH
jgi:hypothetical protein